MSAETPWQRARKSRSTLQEERLGKLPGGEKQVNSGRLWRWKRDGKLSNEFLIEARTTTSRSYSIEKDEFLRIKREALKTPPGLLPAMQIDIQDLSLIAVELLVFNDMLVELVALRAKVYGE